MATTIRLVPSAYTRSSSSRVTVTNPTNMYYNTDHTADYCSIRGRNSSSNTYYAFIHGFNFDDVPSTATNISFSIKIRCYKNSYLQQGTTYRPRLASSPSSSSVLSGTTLEYDVTTTAGGTVYTFPTPSTLTWSTLKGYGSSFSIEIPLRSSSNSYPYLYVYGAEISVTYDEGGGSTDKLYFKQNGSWVQASKAYKKVNGSWVEQSDLTTVFNNSTNYLKGN